MTHITIKREVLEQAIDALDNALPVGTDPYAITARHEVAITALRTALETQGVEPVAWLITSPDGDNLAQVHKPTALLKNEVAVPLFTRAALEGRK